MDSNFSISKQNVPQNIARSAYDEEVKGSHLGSPIDADLVKYTKPASTVQEDDAEKTKVTTKDDEGEQEQEKKSNNLNMLD